MNNPRPKSIAVQYLETLTVGQFCELNNISIEDLLVQIQRVGLPVSFAVGTEPSGQLTIGEVPQAPAAPERDPNEPNLRSPEGRAAYDAKILRALFEAGGWIKAPALRQIIGGKSGQLRQRLTALSSEDVGDVEYQGQAAGMEYKLTRKARDRIRREQEAAAAEE